MEFSTALCFHLVTFGGENGTGNTSSPAVAADFGTSRQEGDCRAHFPALVWENTICYGCHSCATKKGIRT